MKMYTQKTTASSELSNVRCNRCGREIARDGFGYFEDYLNVEKTWGYNSPIDGERHAFDVCAECCLDWFGTFKIPPGAEK